MFHGCAYKQLHKQLIICFLTQENQACEGKPSCMMRVLDIKTDVKVPPHWLVKTSQLMLTLYTPATQLLKRSAALGKPFP